MATAKTKLITPVATLSYPHLDKPQEPQGGVGKAKYSAALVFKPGENLAEMVAAAITVAQAKWPGKDIPAMFANNALRSPFRKDGAEKGYADGSVFINVRSEQPPQIVSTYPGPDGKPMLIEGDDIVKQMYAGAQVRASVTAFAYDSNGNKGVSFALGNIQKVGDGPRIDGRKAATDEFDADLSAAPVDLASLLK
jgi:hypothetical protein